MRTVDSALAAVAERLEAATGELVDAMLLRMRAEIPDFPALEGPELADATRQSAHANVRTGIAALVDGASGAARAPAEAERGARRAALAGAGLHQLLATYRIGHAVCWERALDEIEALDLEPATRLELLRVASRRLFAYVESVTPIVTATYTRERDALLRGGEHRRLRALREVLDGTRRDAPELGYGLRGRHLGAIAWGEDPSEAVELLAQTVAGPTLVVGADAGLVWAWFAVTASEAPPWARIEALPLPAGTFVALGSPGSALEGFRSTHREAERAAVVARRTGRPLTRFDAVSVEALALADEPAARELVARELGPLASGDARSTTLRETLRAYFDASSNASAAAALLGVNDRTVAYRLRGIEDLLGHPVSTRALELGLALRLERVLGAPGDAPGC